MAILINDVTGNTWSVVVDNAGDVSAVSATKQNAPQQISLNPATGYFHTDYPSVNHWDVYPIMRTFPVNSWSLGVTTGGDLVPASIPFNAQWPLYTGVLSSTNGTVWRVYINSAGAVLSSQSYFDSPVESSFGNSVGQLDPYSDQLKGVQPTPTAVIDPDQYPEAKLGWFTASCGHSFMNWDISPNLIDGQPMVSVRCPMCGIIQNTYTQAEIDAMQIVLG